MTIAAIEQWFIDTIKPAFTGRLRVVESLPADWDAKTFERIFRAAPGVFVVFGGGRRLPEYQDDLVIAARWGFVAVTTHASGELARRRGDSREIGAYEILQVLASLLEGVTPPGAVGPLHFDDVTNLFDDANEVKGAALYGLEGLLPMPLVDPNAATPTLDDFLRYDDTFDLAPPDGQAEAFDHVDLPQ